MKRTILTFLVLSVTGAVLVGCGEPSTAQQDTSPLPPMDAKTRAENASKKIAESTTMTPEQKKAAMDYVNQGAVTAEKSKEVLEPAQNAAKK